MRNLDRRELLFAAAAGVLSSVGNRCASAGAAPPRGMTLGFSTYGLKSLTTEKSIEVVREAGYDSIEICVTEGWDADSATLTKSRRNSIRTQLAAAGLRLTSLMEHVHPENDEQQRIALERLKQAAGVAHELCPESPPLVQTTLGGGKWEQIREPLRDRLSEWVKIADAMEIVMAIKPHRGGGVSQPAEAVWLLEQLGRPSRLRMVFDYSHYAFRDLPLPQMVQVALPYTVHIAVKDALEEKGRVVFRLAGEAGTIDYPALLRQFHQGGYQGDVNCEVSGMIWNQPTYDPLRAVRDCYARMSRAFEQAGVPRR